MNAIFTNDWIMLPVIGGSAFFVSYLWADKIIAWLHRQSLGQREEVLRYLELMFVETDRSKVTMMMLTSSFGIGALIFLVLWPNLTAGIVLGGAITIAMWSVPKLVVQMLWNRRCNTFVDQMVDGMTMMANGVKAGLSVQKSMERIQNNLGNPISQEFGLVLSQIRIGRSLQESLNELAIRIPRQDVQMFVTSVNILQETGGNMGETFKTIVEVVRERQKVEKKIEALTAQGMAQGTIIVMVPFALLLVFWALDPNYIKPLFSTTLGLIAVVIMLALQVIGGVAMRKIIKINV
ncbi:MAG: type II secretion system F family protein [Bdellovibrionales bacterium]|jgi:tight adherence protein B|nr:type II secretion system F family protein [Bdellovibrionales bacterium]